MKTFSRNILPFILLAISSTLSAQSIHVRQDEAPIKNFSLNEDDTLRYSNHYLFEQAYQAIEDMLTGKRAASFKEAVFAVENAFLEGGANKQAYDYKIKLIADNILRDAADLQSTMPSEATAKNLAITLFFAEDRASNNYQRCTYDTHSLFNDGGLVGGMVLSLLQNWKGTCRSLPYLYRILAEEIGAPSYIACAPMHFYIKHQDNLGKWWCFETTRYTYCAEDYIIRVNNISSEAITSGLYTKPLTEKETLCLCLYDLCYFYEKVTGFYSNAFVRKCYQLGLRYAPISNLRTTEINDLKYQLDKDLWNRGGRSEEDLNRFPDLKARQLEIRKKLEEYNALGHYEYSRQQIREKMQQIKEFVGEK